MIFLLDNYDSFTYNLYQYLGELGADINVARNDKISVAEIMQQSPVAVVVSPGPGRPTDAGITKALIRECAKRQIPMLGVCLGHQALGEEFGGIVEPAKTLMHGKTSRIRHDGKTLFANVEQSLKVMRYHSLVLNADSVPDEFERSAHNESGSEESNEEGGELMAIRHKTLPLEGVQFHPESIMTVAGKTLLKNFLNHYLNAKQ